MALNPTPDFWRDRRVLLTGHTGFKGAWLAWWLHRMGAYVHGFALAPERAEDLYASTRLDERIVSTLGDLRDAACVADTVERARPEIVLHLAAQPLVRRSYEDPVLTFETNVMGTVHLLQAVRRTPSVRAVVVVTSDKCYENREWPWPYREDDPLGGHDPYSASKACTELVASAWRRSYLAGARSVAVATARAGNVIGGGDWATDRLVPDCVRALRAGAPVAIRQPHATRPWQHVLEPLAGYLLLAERLDAGDDAAAQAFNFGPAADEIEPVSGLVDRLVRHWGDGARWCVDGEPHPHEAATLAVDASKARQVLGWRPRLSLDDAVAMTVSWYKRHAVGASPESLVAEQIEHYEATA